MAAFELEATAVADGHSAEPRAFGLGGGRGVRAERDREPDLVAFATNSDRRADAARVIEEHVEHATELGLLAEDLGAAARLDLDARVGRDLPEERRDVDAPAPRGRRFLMHVREHLHHVVERVERVVDGGITRHDLGGLGAKDLDSFAEPLGRALGLLRQQPPELLPRQPAF